VTATGAPKPMLSPRRDAAFGTLPVAGRVESAAPRIVLFEPEIGGVDESEVIGWGPSGAVPGDAAPVPTGAFASDDRSDVPVSTPVRLVEPVTAALLPVVLREFRMRASDETVARLRLVSLPDVGRGSSPAVGSVPVEAAGNCPVVAAGMVELVAVGSVPVVAAGTVVVLGGMAGFVAVGSPLLTVPALGRAVLVAPVVVAVPVPLVPVCAVAESRKVPAATTLPHQTRENVFFMA
jgi:hypothetical protein